MKKSLIVLAAVLAVAGLARAEKLISRAGQKRLIHPNTAARYKSRLSKLK